MAESKTVPQVGDVKQVSCSFTYAYFSGEIDVFAYVNEEHQTALSKYWERETL
jgi:hypothetical protein